MSWPPTENDIRRAKMMRQMMLSLREQARREQTKIKKLQMQNQFARYVLQFFDQENK